MDGIWTEHKLFWVDVCKVNKGRLVLKRTAILFLNSLAHAVAVATALPKV